MTYDTRSAAAAGGPMRAVMKLCGADAELGNFILDEEATFEHGAHASPTGAAASRALLERIRGLPGRAAYTWRAACPIHGAVPAASGDGGGWQDGASDERWAHSTACTCRAQLQDWGRKFLPANGGCVYIDLDHLELCLPEMTSAFDHVACWHAMLRIAQSALDEANSALLAGRRIVVLVNNSDGHSHSWGAHLSFLITRRSFESIFETRLHHLHYLASYLASAIVFGGAGKVGSENGRAPVQFQISQRADYLECICGPQTTYRRPIVNCRDESLTGSGDGLARFHCISFDNTLCHVASLLKVGVTQLVLAMVEAEEVGVDALLDSPLEALGDWSRDPELRATARLADGSRLTAVELQRRFLAHATRFVAAGRASGIVPHAGEILARWIDVLERLERDPRSLAGAIDWILKRALLERAIAAHGLDWRSDEVKHLDHVYSSLDREEGLYWACERAGSIERVAGEREIAHFTHRPPADTRAWSRAHLLRAAGRDRVDDVDWNFIRFRLPDGAGWPEHRTLSMPDPLGFGRAEAESAFRGGRGLGAILAALDRRRAEQPSEHSMKGRYEP